MGNVGLGSLSQFSVRVGCFAGLLAAVCKTPVVVCVVLSALTLWASPAPAHLVVSDIDQRGNQNPADQPVCDLKEADEESEIALDEFESLLCLVEPAVAGQLLSVSTERIDDELAHLREPVPHGHDRPRAPPELSC
jgi:hypothetical protein